jgi:N-acetylglutamate synthase-like GNAT family acetyltransferase
VGTRIEPAKVKDAPAILALQRQAYASEALIYPGITLPPMVQTLEEMEKDIRTMTVLKAVQGDKLIGSVRAAEQEGVCRIGRLIVAPGHQGRGAGTRLMAAVEKAFAAAPVYELFTGEKSLKNIGFYKKLGYVRTEARKISPGLTLIFFRKERA